MRFPPEYFPPQVWSAPRILIQPHSLYAVLEALAVVAAATTNSCLLPAVPTNASGR